MGHAFSADPINGCDDVTLGQVSIGCLAARCDLWTNTNLKRNLTLFPMGYLRTREHFLVSCPFQIHQYTKYHFELLCNFCHCHYNFVTFYYDKRFGISYTLAVIVFKCSVSNRERNTIRLWGGSLANRHLIKMLKINSAVPPAAATQHTPRGNPAASDHQKHWYKFPD